jgi:regulator of RNase E activity RraA
VGAAADDRDVGAGDMTRSATDLQVLLEKLRGISTADISDALTRLNLQAVRMTGILPLKPFADDRHIAGPAVTIRFLPCHRKEQYQESEYKLTQIVEDAPAGSVIVVAADGEEPIPPIQGEMNALTEIRSRVEAHVGNTPFRDVDRLLGLELPMFHRRWPAGINMGSYVGRMYCAGANEPVHCGGALVRPGDIVVGDNNGVVVAPVESVEAIAEISEEIVELESALRTKVLEGVSWRDIYPSEHKRKYVGGRDAHGSGQAEATEVK